MNIDTMRSILEERLIELLAIRLDCHKMPTKSLVMVKRLANQKDLQSQSTKQQVASLSLIHI